MTVNSPSRSSRRDSWEASMQQQQQQENNDITNGNGIGFGQSTTPVRGRSPVSQKARRSVTPPRSGGESDEEDGDFDDYDFNDNDSVCSGSEEPSQPGKGTWTREEHRKFLEAIKIYVNGPWKLVAEYVGTRTVRQTMTHAQKYRQKAARRIRGLRTKQAIMRMHHGHEVSEESMVQEQIRTMLGQSRHAYLPPDLVATLSNSPYGSPVGSPYMPSSPVMPRSPLMSPAMPGSPVMNGDPGMFAHDPMSMGMPPSLLSSRLETPLSITIRSAHMGGEDSMPVYAPATPPPSYGSSPATSPVSALTNRMAMHGLASPVAQHQGGGGGFEADIFDGFDTTPSFDDMNESQSLGHMDHSSQSLGHMDHSQQSLGPMDSSLAHIMNPVSLEDANVLMEVLFDGPSSLKDEPQDTHLMPQQNQFDIDI